MSNPKFYNTDAAAEHYLGMRWPKAIWQAVLEQAIRDIIHGPDPYEMVGMATEQAHSYREAIYEAAISWVNDTANEPRRFEWVCEQLGLEPSAVRRSIYERKN